MEPLLLYSVNSALAYNINKKYHKKHYVWCATKFNTNDALAIDRNNPKTSNPIEIIKLYNDDLNDVLTDRHHNPYFLIERLNGILYGLGLNTEISEEVQNEINSTIRKQKKDNSIWTDMKPVLYIIPYNLVKDRVKPVPPSKAARFSSEEYIIEDLRDGEFDIVFDLGR